MDSRSPESVQRTVDRIERFIAQARANAAPDDQRTRHQQAEDHKEKEEKSDSHNVEQARGEMGDELAAGEVAEEADQGSAQERELRGLMDELASRPELMRWAAEKERLEEEERNDDDEQSSAQSRTAPNRLLHLAADMREESALLASRHRPLLSSARPSSASLLSSFSLLSAAERRLCSSRLTSLQRQVSDEARQRRSTQQTLRVRMADEERRRRAALRRVESAAVERAVAAAMGRNRRDEREIETMVAEQADRVRQLIGMKTEGARRYYREQLDLVREDRDRQEEERSIQKKVRQHSNSRRVSKTDACSAHPLFPLWYVLLCRNRLSRRRLDTRNGRRRRGERGRWTKFAISQLKWTIELQHIYEAVMSARAVGLTAKCGSVVKYRTNLYRR